MPICLLYFMYGHATKWQCNYLSGLPDDMKANTKQMSTTQSYFHIVADHDVVVATDVSYQSNSDSYAACGWLT